MPSSNPVTEFLQLAAQSGAATSAQCRQWQVEYGQASVAAGVDGAEALAQWLVGSNRLSRYQAKVLLSGKAGPFVYGPYKLIEKAADGPFQEAFRAIHAESGYPVLLQFISGEIAKSPQALATIEPWIVRLTQIGHPNIHAWFEYQTVGAYKFVVLDELAGRPLEQVISAGKLESSRACWIGQQLAEALQALHRGGLAHGHLRPDQAWQDPFGKARLLLHGLVPWLASRETPELHRADYLAPELSQPGRVPNAQTDLYALGCCMYEMLAGRPPFGGRTVEEKMTRHATEAIRPLDSFGVPPALSQLVTYLMAKNPAVRFQSVEDIIPQLATMAGDEPHRMPPQPAVPTERAFWQYLRQQAASQYAPAQYAPAQYAPAQYAPFGQQPPLSQGPISPPISAQPLTMQPSVAQPMYPQGVPSAAPSAPRVSIAVRKGKRYRRRSSFLVMAIILVSLVAIGGSIGYVWFDRMPKPAVAGTDDKVDSVDVDRQGSKGPASGTGSSSVRPTLVEDDGKTLWASPTAGRPMEFAQMAPDAIMVVVVRPADLTSQPEGQQLLKALGPPFEEFIARWTAESKLAWSDVEQLIISFHDGGGEQLRFAFVVRLKSPVPRGELLAAWGKPSEKTSGVGTYFAGSQWSYYLPQPKPTDLNDTNVPVGSTSNEVGDDTGTVSVFAMGAEEEIKLVADRQGTAPPLRSGIEPLLRLSDDQRLLTVFFEPHFLRANLLREGREFYFGPAQRLLAPLETLLGDGVRTGMFSLHLDERLYLELALTGDVTRDRLQLASDVRDRLSQLANDAETYLAANAPSEYWRPVAERFPKMVRFLQAQSRVQVENGVAVVNSVLPKVAAHNLAFGAEMLLASDSAPAAAATAKPADPTKPVPPTLDALLLEKKTLRFDEKTLEVAFRDIVQEIKDSYGELPFEFDIVLMPKDLQKDGISKNQSITEFAVEDAPLADVLTALVMRGNPITTVINPMELDQKLIWVIGDDPDQAGRRVILITTRDGADIRELPLPKVFEPEP